MERYDYIIEYNKFACEDQAVFTECEDGEWVRFIDAKEKVENLQAANDKCKEKFQYIRKEFPDVWKALIESDARKFDSVFEKEEKK